MDCGPAALHCLLKGFGIATSFGRLREACQTDVDGTSIDALEDLARQLGLEAEQIMLPADHLFLPGPSLLPAIAVVRRPNHLTHFVVLWRRHGPWVQIMDPASGRHWLPVHQLLRDLYVHSQRIPETGWREWAGSPAFLNPLEHRLGLLKIPSSERQKLIQTAVSDKGWKSLAALDAATRMTHSLVNSRAVRGKWEAEKLISTLLARWGEGGFRGTSLIPSRYWSALLCASTGPNLEPDLILRGVVLVSVPRRKRQEPSAAERDSVRTSAWAASLGEKIIPPWRRLAGLLLCDGWGGVAGLGAALLLAAGGVIGEALLLRGLFEVGRQFVSIDHRLIAMVVLLAFVALMLGLDWGTARGLQRLGRRLEARLRIAFLEKIPRLGDRYFQSRLLSDMAERLHIAYSLRSLPPLAGQWLRTLFELGFTVAGIAWLDPSLTSLTIFFAALALALPFLLQPWLAECDMRLRIHTGALSRFFLDAMAGILAIRAHAAGGVICQEHDHLLAEWVKAGAQRGRAALLVQGLEGLLGVILAAVLFFSRAEGARDPANFLLLVYWVLNLPMLANTLAAQAEQYAIHRNISLRLLEPLGAAEEKDSAPSTISAPGRASSPPKGCSIRFEKVTVHAGGQVILKELDLEIAPGSHVAVVGPSGAGKSTLLGTLLGWHRPARGEIQVDGCPLSASRLEELRQQTAWADPSIRLWNQPLIDNLFFGTSPDRAAELSLPEALETASLHRLLEKLPGGLQTILGEAGGRLSGGEGQLVRLARAWLRPDVRLVLLDEAFQGLGRGERCRLLEKIRQKYRPLTLLCVLHDLAASLQFDRVLVMERGQVVEDGSPQELALAADSRYRKMLKTEEQLQKILWSPPGWRQAQIREGRWVESASSEATSWNR
jgi:ATP-binding cassette subfamily B protein